ncbi:MAG: Coenzyme F420 hydrogenase/dehydrogenase, beta subunit C-terminal domain [Candidatus Cloacimonetes bacterium]|nr:Coenzyme F420 hydrogenase/dehydrogenase, beta subunit C-terminal domain [Candidatus Cloacimonadota bacterium]
MRPNKEHIGQFNDIYLGYSKDPEVRSGAASGGVVSQILLNLLDQGAIDEALVSRIEVKSGEVYAKVICAKTKDEILSARTSIYFDFDLLKQLVPLIAPEKKYAIVLLPCQAKAFEKLCEVYGWDRDRFFIVGLFCGHATDKELLNLYFKKKAIAKQDIDGFTFRVGHWRGKSRIIFTSGEERYYPTMHYNIYQNLFFFTKRRCLSCVDHFASHADISCGDAWIRSLKGNLIKHSMIISRNDTSDSFLRSSKETIQMTKIDWSDLLKAQKRSIIYHNCNIHGRKFWAPLFKVNIVVNDSQKPKWNDIVGAFFILLNYKISCKKWGQNMIMKLPYPILFAYAMFIKVFINF